MNPELLALALTGAATVGFIIGRARKPAPPPPARKDHELFTDAHAAAFALNTAVRRLSHRYWLKVQPRLREVAIMDELQVRRPRVIEVGSWPRYVPEFADLNDDEQEIVGPMLDRARLGGLKVFAEWCETKAFKAAEYPGGADPQNVAGRVSAFTACAQEIRAAIAKAEAAADDEES